MYRRREKGQAKESEGERGRGARCFASRGARQKRGKENNNRKTLIAFLAITKEIGQGEWAIANKGPFLSGSVRGFYCSLGGLQRGRQGARQGASSLSLFQCLKLACAKWVANLLHRR